MSLQSRAQCFYQEYSATHIIKWVRELCLRAICVLPGRPQGHWLLGVRGAWRGSRACPAHENRSLRLLERKVYEHRVDLSIARGDLKAKQAFYDTAGLECTLVMPTAACHIHAPRLASQSSTTPPHCRPEPPKPGLTWGCHVEAAWWLSGRIRCYVGTRVKRVWRRACGEEWWWW